MAIARAISAARRDEYLSQLAQRAAGVELHLGKRPDRRQHRSRALSVVNTEEEKHLVIELPSEEGKSVTIHPGDLVDIIFLHNGQRLGFEAEVIKRKTHQINEKVSVPAMVVSYPDEILIRQRRFFYRVRLSESSPSTVTFDLNHTDGEAAETASSGEPCTGVIYDISAGGMGVYFRQHLSGAIRMRDHVEMYFQVPGSSESVQLEGSIRAIHTPPSGPGFIVGVEFLNTDRSPEIRRTMDAIQKFVAARQREVIRETKTPEA